MGTSRATAYAPPMTSLRLWTVLSCLVACGTPSEERPTVPAEVPETGTPPDSGPVFLLDVRVTPAQARAGLDALTCTTVEGATLEWEHDGAPTGLTGPVVPAHLVGPGDWTCTGSHDDVTGRGFAHAAPVGGNLMVLLLDDVGLDKIAAYGMHPGPPPPPHLDQLAAEGVRFTNAYATPMCSPTRAALLSGQLPTRNGVGYLVHPTLDERWLIEADTIPEVLARSPLGAYTSAVTGKWHLTRLADTHHPAALGFTYYSGSMSNPGLQAEPGRSQGYFQWEKNVQGTLGITDTYMTVDTVDDAIDHLATLPEPWFLYVPFNAAHEPFHKPPDELHTRTILPESPDVERLDAMIEALDRELGRLLAAMTDAQRATTTIVVIGDNGTQAEGIRPPLKKDRGKGSLYEGGVRVPMMVISPHLAHPGTASDALVHVVDVLPTAAAMAGVELDPSIAYDGISLLPLLADPEAEWPREVLYSEKFRPNGFAPEVHWSTIRDHQYKLIVDREDHLSFFELTPGQLDEGQDLLVRGNPLEAEQQAALDRLIAELQRIEEDLAP